LQVPDIGVIKTVRHCGINIQHGTQPVVAIEHRQNDFCHGFSGAGDMVGSPADIIFDLHPAFPGAFAANAAIEADG